eukprot:s5233_g5.t1
MGETVDPLRWSYKELIETFPAYHEGADGESRPLRDFASRLPASASRPREDPQPQEEARPSRPQPKPKEQATDRGQRTAAKPRRAAAARIPEVLPVRSQAPAAAPRGPVPPPFAAGPSLPEDDAQEDEEEEEADTGEAEALSPEQYAEWLKYYRECIEYFQQCEQNCAKEAGVEPPPRMASNGQGKQDARQPLPFPSEAPPSLGSLGLGASPALASLLPPSLPEGLGATPQPLLQAVEAFQQSLGFTVPGLCEVQA